MTDFGSKRACDVQLQKLNPKFIRVFYLWKENLRLDMTKIKDWLEGIPSPNTRKSYMNGIKKFETFYGKGIETLIGTENAGKVIEKFYVWLKGRGHTQNSCRNITNAPIQFLKFFDTKVKYRKSLGIYKTVLTARDHILSRDEAKEMYRVGSLAEKVMVKTWLQGLRVSDASRLEWQQFNIKPQEKPVEVLISTRKEDVLAHCFIDVEFQKLLQKHTPNLDHSNKYLFQSEKGGRVSEKQLVRKLQSLQKRAHIKARGSFGWHIGRKLFLRVCAENGVNRWSAMLMVGKSVPKDIGTYLNGVSLRKDAEKIAEILSMESKPNGRIINLQSALIAVEKENATLKTRVDVLQDELKSVEGRLAERDGEIADLEQKLSESTEKSNRRLIKIERILKIEGD